jgi:hypothetical protein
MILYYYLNTYFNLQKKKKKKGNCREGLVALGQSSSETFSTVVLSISTAIQSSYGKTLVFMQTSGRTLSCGID